MRFQASIGRPTYYKMTKAEFHTHLYAATRMARDFAREFTKTKLYDDFLFHARLNQSAFQTEEDQVFYPEDDFKWLRNLSHDETVELLWREDRVPHWINVRVAYTEKRVTHIDLLCCGRYVKDPDKLYYTWNGTAPFGVKSPMLNRWSDEKS